MTPPSLSLVEAARALNISRRTLYYYIAQGRVQTIRVGQSQRVLVASLPSDWERPPRNGKEMR